MPYFGFHQHTITRERRIKLDYNSIVQAIGSVGFPIVACVGLFWMVNTTMKELTGAINSLNETIVKLTTKIAGDA